MSARLPVLLMAVAAIAAIGCGSSSSGTTASESGTTAAEAKATTDQGAEKANGSAGEKTGEGTPTGAAPALEAQFVKQVNAICRHAKAGLSEDIEAYEREHETSSEEVEGELLTQATVAVFFPKLEREIEEIRALAAQTGEEAKVAPYLEALESGLASNPEPSSLGEFAEQFKVADKLAPKYGFESCFI